MGFINTKKHKPIMRSYLVKTLLNKNDHHNAGNKKIINVANPTEIGDAVNLSYLNSITNEIERKKTKLYFATTNTRQNFSGSEWTTINHLRITFPSLLKATLCSISSTITTNENVYFRVTVEVNGEKTLHYINSENAFHFAINKTKGNDKTVTFTLLFLLPKNTTNVFIEGSTLNKRNSNNNSLFGNLILHMYETELLNHINNNHGIYLNAEIK